MADKKKVGVVNVIAVIEMRVITYVFETYELAEEQAKELLKNVKSPVDKMTNPHSSGKLRNTVYRIAASYELIMVQETEVGTEILKVEKIG